MVFLKDCLHQKHIMYCKTQKVISGLPQVPECAVLMVIHLKISIEIYEDNKGRIWFVPFSCKLSYYYNDSIYQYEYNEKLQKKLISPNPIKMSFYIDKNETVYIGIYGHPVITITKNGHISELPHYDLANSVVTIHILNNQKLLISNQGNFNKYIIINSGGKIFKVKADFDYEINTGRLKSGTYKDFLSYLFSSTK